MESRAALLHGKRANLERTVPGVLELNHGSALDQAAITDEVTIALLPEKLRVDGQRAREPFGAENHAPHSTITPVLHHHLKHRVDPSLRPVACLQYIHARRCALVRPRS